MPAPGEDFPSPVLLTHLGQPAFTENLAKPIESMALLARCLEPLAVVPLPPMDYVWTAKDSRHLDRKSDGSPTCVCGSLGPPYFLGIMWANGMAPNETVFGQPVELRRVRRIYLA